MLKPFTFLSRLVPLALVGMLALPARAQTYTPVALTGYNQDVIAEGTGAVPNLTTYDVDGSNGAGYSFMSANYVNPSNAANGATNKIPNNGLITSIAAGTTGLTYQLASYGANNVLRVPATGNTGGGTGTGADAGTITFATPSAASTVYVLATGGGGAITNGMTVTITFSDGTTQVFSSQTLPDWFTPAGATVAYQGFGRVARTAASGIDNTSATTPNLYQLAYSILPANVTKPIASITFGKTVTATGVIDVFAVSTATVPVCAAAPSNLSAAATTTSGGSTALTSACASTSIYLSVTGLPANTAGYTYQWQASTTSATTGFANISGATSATYTATNQTATTYYRVLVSCLYDGAGGTAVPSSAVQVTQNPITSCYCVPTHSSTSTSYTSVTTVTLPGDGGATLTNAPGLLTSTSPGYAAPYYAIYPASTTTTALSVNGNYTLTVAAIAFQRISAWIDYNQDGAFDASEFYILKNTSGAVYGSSAGNLTATLVPPPGALTGATRLRIRSDYYSNTVLNTGTNACATTVYGEALDYTVTVTATPCTSAPPAPSISTTAFSVCAGTAFTLTASMPPVGLNGYTYQWQSSPAGANTFTNLGTAQTTTTYAVATQTAATDYRVLLLCAAGGSAATATSNVLTVGQNPFYYCTCTPVTSGTGTDGITNVTLGALNNNSSTTNASPYYTDYSSAQLTGALPTPVLTTGGSAMVSVKMGSDSNQYSGVWIDFDHSGTFDASEFFTLGTNAGASGTSVIPITVPASALTGLTKIRVRGGNDVVLLASQACTAASSSSNYGEVEDYLVNIGTATACGGTLPATAATATTSAACTATASFTLNVTGLAAGTTGLTYQWQSSPAGTNNYTNLGSAQATPSYAVASQTASTDYRVVVTCTASGSTSTSSPVTVGQQATCYCAPVSTGTNEYIESVTVPGFNGFTNSSLVNTPGGYADYTTAPGLTTTLNQGVSYPVTVVVRSNNGGSQGGIWIDYDHSGTFDASEYTLLGTSSALATDVPLTVSVTVPATALLGPARVRVRWRNGSFAATDACTGGATTWYGETEDYLINIVAPCTPSTATFSYGGAPFCVSGTTNPTVTLASGSTAGTFTATPAGLTLNASTGAVTLSSSTPGTYTVTNTVAATAAQCGSSATTTITINAAPTAGFSYASGPYCVSGATNPTATLAGGATAGAFSSTAGLTLNATTGAITLSSSTPGTYTVTNTVAAANGCAAVTSTATVTINAAPTAGFSYPTTTLCAGTAATLTPTMTTGATVGTFSLPAATGVSVNANGVVTIGATAAAGTYTVTNTVAAANGCAQVIGAASFTITPQTTATFSYPAGPYCVSGSTNPTPTVTGTAGGAFSSTSGLTINPTTGAVTLSSSTPGTYTVTYAVAGTCGSSSTQTLTINAAPTAGFSYPAATLCAGTSATLTPTLASGASVGTYSLPTAPGLTINASTGVVTLGAAATAGTYTVTNTVAAANGCAAVTSTATFTLTAPSTATFSYGAGTFCASGTTNPVPTITGTAGGTFSSTTGLSLNPTTGAITLSTSTVGTYTVTYAVSSTCSSSSTQSVTITAAPLAAFSYPAGTNCASSTGSVTPALGTGASAGTFTASPAGLTINASTGVVDLSNSAAGTYTVTNTIAASGSCAAATATATLTVTPATTATFSYAAGPYCVSGSTNPVATITGTAGGAFSSTTGLSINANTGAINLGASTAGTYTVTYTVPATATQCGSSATASVTINAAPTAAFSYGSTSYCVSGTLAPVVALGTGATAGTFTAAPTGLTINATTGAITLSSSTPGTYTVTNTVAAANGCAAVTSTASVTITAAPTAAFTYPTATTCAGSAATLTPTLGTGATAGTYSLPTAAGLSVNATTGVVTVSATATAGTYTVTNAVAAANGCAAVTTTATFTLTAPSTATFSYPAATYCLSGTNPTATITGTTGGTFTSTTGLSINASTGAINLSGSTAGTYTVTYTVSGACGSSSTQSVTITAPAVATFSYGTASTFCVSGTTDPTVILVPGATRGTFNSAPAGLTLLPSGLIVLSTSTPGTYTVTNTVAAAGGCAATTATTTVTITAAPLATFGYTTGTNCQGAGASIPAILFTGATAGTFTSTAGLVINAATGAVNLSTSVPGAYTVTNTIAASSGCSVVTATAPFFITARPATPTISATYNGTTTTLTSSATTGNQWYLGPNIVPGATGQTLVLTGLPSQLGSYTVVTTSSGPGCTSLPSNPLVVTSGAKAAAGTSLTVYPNPTTNGHLTLELTGYREAVTVRVLNAVGQRVYEGTVAANALGQKQALDLSALATGVYILQASTASGSMDVRRIVRE
ncbi:GEVED domain-containing protein [Hymenobacter sp. M29]|uniref:GEVED domain-containing protein n=1 Tax=Hymenobacter mellowenesis TaxID=3063995 RepID=A0ABT9ACV2_9BACT|nr:GEVED domain-containing protein [Hymenobacter sp. M29]MDO7847189.1 GEVED domain-containing protein [Hymenobacter sp. M29]